MSGVDRALVKELKDAEDARFHEARARSAELWTRAWDVMPNGVPMAWLRGSYHHMPPWVDSASGARFTDVDRFSYADFNIADMSMFCGYAPEPLVRAVSDVMARGHQFLLPTEDAIVVADELGRRYGLPKMAVHALGDAGERRGDPGRARRHGARQAPAVRRQVSRAPRSVARRARPERCAGARGARAPGRRDRAHHGRSLQRPRRARPALDRDDVALVLTEPALTNNVGPILPDEGFHRALRDRTRAARVLLAMDETHTQVVGPGGLTSAWDLEPDLVTAGNSIAGGVPFGAWGMTDEVAMFLTQIKGPDGERSGMIAIGGTLFGNALSMAAARATMLEILTPDAYAGTQRLGSRLADGMRSVVVATDLPWHVHHLGPRSGYTFRPEPIRERTRGPRQSRRSARSADPDLDGQPRRMGGDRGRGSRRPDAGER